MATAKKAKKANGKSKSKPIKAKSKTKVKVKAKAQVRAKPQGTAKPKLPAKPKAKVQTKSNAPTKTKATIVWSQVISPLEDRLIVSFVAPSEVTAGGIIIPGTVSEAPNKGKVLAVGPGRRSKKGKLRPVDVKVGDEVIFPQHAGSKMTVQNTEILILREEEILGIIQ